MIFRFFSLFFFSFFFFFSFSNPFSNRFCWWRWNMQHSLKNIAVQSGIQYVLLNWCLNRSIFHLKHFCSFIVMVCQFSSWQTWICYTQKIVVIRGTRISAFTFSHKIVWFFSFQVYCQWQTLSCACQNALVIDSFVETVLKTNKKCHRFVHRVPIARNVIYFSGCEEKNLHINFLSFTLGLNV